MLLKFEISSLYVFYRYRQIMVLSQFLKKSIVQIMHYLLKQILKYPNLFVILELSLNHISNEYKTNQKMIPMSKFTPEQISEINDKLKTPEEVLQWGLENIHPKLALASSFGAEDVCVIHMLSKINPEARVFSLDTGRINQETYNVMDEIRKKYNTKIEITFPDATEVIEMVQTHGMNLFYESAENRKLCCGVRKVHPLNKMLSTLDGWITGLRSDQTQNRQASKKIEIDEQHDSMVKLNPILDWSWDQTMGYIKENDIPYNKLIDQGFPSIGCEPCTRAIKPGEDLRAGRWWWENESDKECGLHMDHSK